MDDTEAAAMVDSAATACSAAQSTSAAAAPTPAPRRSGRSRTSSVAGSAGRKRLSAAAANSAPSSSHASASINESKRLDAVAAASSPAPSNKRARTAKHTAAAAASAASSTAAAASSAAQSSPMIRILGRDTGGQFVLCEMLELAEIAQLHQSCRSWRRWINNGTFGSGRLLQFESRVPLSLRSSAWAPRYVQRLVLGIPPVHAYDSSDSEADYNPPEPDVGALEEGRFDEIILRLLPRLNRLRALQLLLRPYGDPIVLPPLLPLTSSTLTSLVLDVRTGWKAPGNPFASSFMRSLGGVPSLTSLCIASDTVHLNFAELDFSVLPSLTQLQHLSIPTSSLARCSPSQVAALVSCRALTALDVGVWAPVDVKSDAQLGASLSKLIRGRNLNSAARLRNIGFGTLRWQSIVTPAVADTLLVLHELERLEHVVWSCELTAEHWSQLSLFSRLHTIHIGAVSAERTELSAGKYRATLQLDAPLLALQHCPSLSSVSLTRVGYSGCWLSLFADHVVLLAALPRMQSLFLRDVSVESLAPLTSAPALTHLMLDLCKGLDGELISMRAAVPRLPLLTSLSIECDWECNDQDGDADARNKFAAVSAAMMERLPLLRPASFHHQSWSTNTNGRQVAPRSPREWLPPVLQI